MDYMLYQRLALFEQRLMRSQLEQALRFHGAWFAQLNRALVCRTAASPSDLGDAPHFYCQLGRWFYGNEDSVLSELKSYRDLGEAHRQVHETAKRLLQAVERGEHPDGDAYDRLIEDSERLLDLIRRLRESLNNDLYISAQVIGRLFADAPQGVLVTSPERTILSANAAFSTATGYGRNELVGKGLGDCLDRERRDELERKLVELRNDGVWSAAVKLCAKEGDCEGQWLTVIAIQDDHGRLIHYLAIFSGAESAAEHEQGMMQLANYHPLTGLPNRMMFQDLLAEALIDRDSALAVMVVDLDGFRTINERFGRAAGDRLLHSAAERLRGGLFEPDVVAHLMGDSFGILVSRVEGQEDVGIVAESVIATMVEPFEVDGEPVGLTPSIGVGIYPEHATDPQQLIAAAQLAILQVKQSGGGSFGLCPNGQCVRALGVQDRCLNGCSSGC